MIRHDFSVSERALRKDPRFARVVKKHGPVVISPERAKHTVFDALLRAIVYQQISGKAAASILSRVEELFPKRKPTPQLMRKMPPKKLRAAGLSPQKLSYVKDLALKCTDDTIDERMFGKMTSEEIIEHVTAVKGVGAWTAHMLLLFTLQRPDILPVGDLGIQKGFQILYGLRSLPNAKKMERLAKPWRAHASAGSWYLWRVADAAKVVAKKPRAARSGPGPAHASSTARCRQS